MHELSSRVRRLGPAWAAVPALLGALAALALPGTTSPATAEAAMLAVGALALLAGHTWGLLVALSSHVPLVGRIWPAVTHVNVNAASASGDTTVAAGAIAVVLVTAVPVVILSMLLFPRLVALLVPGASPRTQAWATIAVAIALGASLVLPAVLA